METVDGNGSFFRSGTHVYSLCMAHHCGKEIRPLQRFALAAQSITELRKKRAKERGPPRAVRQPLPSQTELLY